MTQIASKGTILQLSIASSYTTVAQNIDLKGPDAEVETYDATHLTSGAGKAFKPTGYVDGGTVSGSCFLDPVDTTHTALTALLAAPAVSAWKIKWSDSAVTVWAFSGVLTKFSPAADMSDGLKFDFEIKLDGVVTGW